MAIRYRITKRSNSIQNKKEQFIMQAVHTGKIDLDFISYAISNECTLHAVDVKAVLMALGIKLDFYLQEGKVVDLGDVGKFKMGFKSTAEDHPTKLSPKRNIIKHHINYQPSVKFKRKLKGKITTYKEGSRSV
jgi:predicted histone-like DNA-binding protein